MKIEHDTAKNRFVATADDGKQIGYIVYEEASDGSLRATHTLVDPVFRGQGMAGKLVDALADYARTRKAKIVPVCPYVARAFEKDAARYADVAK